eukprot:12061960-Karenia_brevis.AAC.1
MVWKFAGALVTQNQLKWPHNALRWNPELNRKGSRRQARPTRRWHDDLAKYMTRWEEYKGGQ